jgi:glycosyltransferase involved in cell wall biosynthesis
MKISVVIPVFNEEKSIKSLYDELIVSLNRYEDFEIIYINDGSTDNSVSEIKKLSNVILIDLNKRYGQATALDAGFKYAKGDVVVSLDADGQNDPKDISSLIDKLEKDNLDVVAGWRKNRKDPFQTRLLTKIGRFLRNLFMADPIHDSGCSLRVYRGDVVKSLDIGGEMHRYIMTLLRWKGYKVGELEVNHRKREHGHSKYNLNKALRGFIDLLYVWFIYKYSQRPLHFFGYMSFVSFLFAILSGAWSLYGKIFWNLSLNRNGWFFITCFLFLSSILFFSFGIAIDLLIKIYLQTSVSEKKYYIRNITRI